MNGRDQELITEINALVDHLKSTIDRYNDHILQLKYLHSELTNAKKEIHNSPAEIKKWEETIKTTTQKIKELDNKLPGVHPNPDSPSFLMHRKF